MASVIDEVENILAKNPSSCRATKWKCNSCTFENDIDLSVCEICSHPRKSNDTDGFGNDPRKINSANTIFTNDLDGNYSSDIRKNVENTKDCIKTSRSDDVMSELSPKVLFNRLQNFVTSKIRPGFTKAAEVNHRNVLPHIGNKSLDTSEQLYTPENDQSYWTCPKCTFYNRSPTLICSVCGNEVTWKCSKCTLVNKNTSFCLMCKSPNSQFRTKQPEISTTDNFDSSSRNAIKNLSLKGLDHTSENLKSTNSLNYSKSDVSKRFKYNRSVKHNSRLMDKSNALDRWNYIRSFCEQTKELFVDTDFPANDSSLNFNNTEPISDGPVRWLRPEHITSDDHVYYYKRWSVCDTPKPSDIMQGILGNCWFLSALTVLSERHDLIESIILTTELCPEGVYLVRLCIDGSWTTILIDDLFPCRPDGRLLFSKARRKQLWVPIIEKALAKVYGRYEALCTGKTLEGLYILTGCPCESIQLHESDQDEITPDKEIIWAQLLSSRESRFLMGASCGSGHMTIDEDIYHTMGLRPRHAYAILDVQDIEGLRLILLRNPWGTASWTGDWSENSPFWSSLVPELREALQGKNRQYHTGTFWIAVDDIFRYFDSIDICKIRDDWQDYRISSVFPDTCCDPPKYVHLTVGHTVEIELTLFQNGHRDKEIALLDLCILVFRAASNSVLPVQRLITASKRQIRSFVSCSYILEPGQYVVLPVAFNKWTAGCDPVSYVLTVHSTKKVMVDNLQAPVSVPILAHAIIQLAVTYGSKTEGFSGQTIYYLKKGWAGLIVVLENRQPDKYVKVTCDCADSYNVVSTRGTLTVHDCIPPLHRQVLIVLSHLESSQGYSINHRLIHYLSPRPGLSQSGSDSETHLPPLTPDVEGLHRPLPL